MMTTTAHTTTNARAWILMVLVAACGGFAVFDLYLLMSLFAPAG